MAQKFLVIGAGRFGSSVAKELFTSGYEVVIVDQEETCVDATESFCTYRVIGDAREDAILNELNVKDYNSIIVSIGDDFESAVYVVAKLKALQCTSILAKANDSFRGTILESVGANRVIYPEEETGKRLARQLSNPGILEFLAIDQHSSVIEVQVPNEFVGKTLVQLDFRRKYNITIVAISHTRSDSKEQNRFIASPSGDEIFQTGDILIAIGENKDLDKFKRKL